MNIKCQNGDVVCITQEGLNNSILLQNYQEDFGQNVTFETREFSGDIINQTFSLRDVARSDLVECLRCADFFQHLPIIAHFARLLSVEQLTTTDVPRHLERYIQCFQKDLRALLEDERLLRTRIELEPGSLERRGTYRSKWNEEYYIQACIARGLVWTYKVWLQHNAQPKQCILDVCLEGSAELGHIELVKDLLDRGANLHAFDNSALYWASRHGYLEVARLLLDRGANIHANNGEALRCTSENGHLEVVRLLLDRGADVHADDDWALQLASDNGHLEVVRLLLDRGANIHANNDLALRLASGNGHFGVVRLLLDRGADIHVDNDDALRRASHNGHLEVVRLLLDGGADIHADNNFALQCASGNGHLEVVRLLLDRGANIHANDDGALRWASGNGHLEVVRLLLDRGADREVALEKAKEYGQEKAIQMLKSI